MGKVREYIVSQTKAVDIYSGKRSAPGRRLQTARGIRGKRTTDDIGCLPV
jgi:hypothetical protein